MRPQFAIGALHPEMISRKSNTVAHIPGKSISFNSAQHSMPSSATGTIVASWRVCARHGRLDETYQEV